MSEFHDEYPPYETMSNHDEEHGKKIRKTIWIVFTIMLVVTIFEILFGIWASNSGAVPPGVLKVVFIGLTLLKAFYIIYKFMHLGDEVKWTKWIIIAPYTGFILYLIFMMTIGEGNYARDARNDIPAAAPTEQHHDAGDKH